MKSIFNKNTTCKNCTYSYEGSAGSNCPSIVIKKYGLPLHCIVNGCDNMKIVYEKDPSCEKFDEK